MASVSVVTPIYNSTDYVEEFYERMQKAVLQITDDFEIIFVDDGSPDNSSEIVQKIIANSNNVQLIELSRNFGHHKAILAGLTYSKKDLIFLIDCDLEEQPELLNVFYDKMKENMSQIDVVYGYVKNRKGRGIDNALGALFYKLLNQLTDITIPENVIMGRLMKKDYVQQVLKYNETHIFLGGIFQLAGFRQIGMPVEKHYKGKTSYSFTNRLASALTAFVSFSSKPLLYLFLIGMVISMISLIFIIYLVVRHLFFEQLLMGWPSLMVSIWFIGGLIISSLGLVGYYVGKTYMETKNRPNFIIRKIYHGKSSN